MTSNDRFFQEKVKHSETIGVESLSTLSTQSAAGGVRPRGPSTPPQGAYLVGQSPSPPSWQKSDAVTTETIGMSLWGHVPLKSNEKLYIYIYIYIYTYIRICVRVKRIETVDKTSDVVSHLKLLFTDSQPVLSLKDPATPLEEMSPAVEASCMMKWVPLYWYAWGQNRLSHPVPKPPSSPNGQRITTRKYVPYTSAKVFNDFEGT